MSLTLRKMLPATTTAQGALLFAFAATAMASNGFFEDITGAGLVHNPSMRSYGISFTDVDGDHRFEAFVCGYGFDNLVYQFRPGAGGSSSLRSAGGGGLHDLAGVLGVQAGAIGGHAACHGQISAGMGRSITSSGG